MDDDLHLSYSSSDTRESQGFNAKYSYPIVYPEVLGLGVEVGYSMYDASSFAITQIDFDGKTEMLDLSLDWKPLELDHANYQWAYEFGLKAERLEAENSLISGRASAELITPRMALVLLTKGTHLRTQSKIELRRNLHYGTHILSEFPAYSSVHPLVCPACTLHDRVAGYDFP